MVNYLAEKQTILRARVKKMEKPQYCLFFSNAALLNVIENTTGQNLIFI